jgi:hypothetical protein
MIILFFSWVANLLPQSRGKGGILGTSSTEQLLSGFFQFFAEISVNLSGSFKCGF